jgi:hypothetical protein
MEERTVKVIANGLYVAGLFGVIAAVAHMHAGGDMVWLLPGVALFGTGHLLWRVGNGE